MTQLCLELMTTLQILSYLTMTFAARGCLKERADFYQRARMELMYRFQDENELLRVIGGLK